VAALGVAVGAIGGALATVGTKLAEMHWWQLPLVLVAVMLAISLPAVIIAWLKLRQRTLGPILDANGWAINGRVKINIPFGTKLTSIAELPAGARRSLQDPYEDKDAKRRRRLIWVLVVVAVVAAGYIRWDHHQRGRYFWQDAPLPVAPVVVPAVIVPAETAKP
jgi:ABC-type branched-subunit amino acid transport system permease subunit